MSQGSVKSIDLYGDGLGLSASFSSQDSMVGQEEMEIETSQDHHMDQQVQSVQSSTIQYQAGTNNYQTQFQQYTPGPNSTAMSYQNNVTSYSPNNNMPTNSLNYVNARTNSAIASPGQQRDVTVQMSNGKCVLLKDLNSGTQKQFTPQGQNYYPQSQNYMTPNQNVRKDQESQNIPAKSLSQGQLVSQIAMMTPQQQQKSTGLGRTLENPQNVTPTGQHSYTVTDSRSQQQVCNTTNNTPKRQYALTGMASPPQVQRQRVVGKRAVPQGIPTSKNIDHIVNVARAQNEQQQMHRQIIQQTGVASPQLKNNYVIRTGNHAQMKTVPGHHGNNIQQQVQQVQSSQLSQSPVHQHGQQQQQQVVQHQQVNRELAQTTQGQVQYVQQMGTSLLVQQNVPQTNTYIAQSQLNPQTVINALQGASQPVKFYHAQSSVGKTPIMNTTSNQVRATYSKAQNMTIISQNNPNPPSTRPVILSGRKKVNQTTSNSTPVIQTANTQQQRQLATAPQVQPVQTGYSQTMAVVPIVQQKPANNTGAPSPQVGGGAPQVGGGKEPLVAGKEYQLKYSTGKVINAVWDGKYFKPVTAQTPAKTIVNQTPTSNTPSVSAESQPSNTQGQVDIPKTSVADAVGTTPARKWTYSKFGKENLTRRPLHVESESQNNQTTSETTAPAQPEKKRVPRPREEGKFALCPNCGTTSQDYDVCDNCHKDLPDDVKYYCPAGKKIKLDTGAVDNPMPPGKFYTISSSGNHKVYHVTTASAAGGRKTVVAKKHGAGRGRKPKKVEPQEIETVTILSSDEEEAGTPSKTASNTDASTSSSPAFFPNQNQSSQIRGGKKEKMEDESGNVIKKGKKGTSKKASGRESPADPEDLEAATKSSSKAVYLKARSIRLGSLRGTPYDYVEVTNEKVILPLQCEGLKLQLIVDANSFCKVLAHLDNKMPVLFIQTTPALAAAVRDKCQMNNTEGPYYDPQSSDDTHKKITVLLNYVSDEQAEWIRDIFNEMEARFSSGKEQTHTLFSEIDMEAANNVLVKSTPKVALSSADQLLFDARQSPDEEYKEEDEPVDRSRSPTPPCAVFAGQIVKLFTYPPSPATGGIAVTNEDLFCLNEGEFLNDVIIDFYLKYIFMNTFSEEFKQKTHIFSSFFYRRLTQRDSRRSMTEEQQNMSAQEKRHARVKMWTRRVDLFDKDFIIVPINESSHWYLAIICFPKLQGPVMEEWKGGKANFLESQKTDSQGSKEEPESTPTGSKDSKEEGQSSKDEGEKEKSEETCEQKEEKTDSAQDSPREESPKLDDSSVVNQENKTSEDTVKSSEGEAENSAEATSENSNKDEASEEKSEEQSDETSGEKESTEEGEKSSVDEKKDKTEDTEKQQENPPEKEKASKPGKKIGLYEPIGTRGRKKKTTGKEVEKGKTAAKNAERPSTPNTQKTYKYVSKQPCILIFDSLSGPSRSGVVRTLREYIQVEWNMKKQETEGPRTFTIENMKGAHPKCPQQSNYSDCGVYVLQYVESFFETPIRDYSVPIKGLTNWFSKEKVGAKREDLRNLILKLQKELNPDLEYDARQDVCL